MKKNLSIILCLFMVSICSIVFGATSQNKKQLRSEGEFQNRNNNKEVISDDKLQNLRDENGKSLFNKKDIRRDSLQTDVMNERLLNGYMANDLFGISVSGAGDVNGDGFDDIITGAYGNDAGGSNAGRAYIYFGGNIFNSVPDVILTGEAAGISFGLSVSSAGDVNGDSYDDVIVGAPFYSSSTGRAYIFFGGATMNNVADVILTGAAVSNFFGYSVSTAGNVNGDGFSDVIVGAYGYSSNTGRAYIYYGGAVMNTVIDVTLTGTAANNFFGVSVSDAGDVNGDGFSDVIAGAYGYSANTGRAYIYYGAVAMNSVADVTMTGEGMNNYFGIAVSTGGDINGDGFIDVIVGADGYNSNKGRAYVFYGAAGMNSVTDVIMSGDATGNFFGTSVSNAGNSDGDCYGDIIIGAKYHSSGTGRAYIFKGGVFMDTIRDKILSGETAGDNFASSVSSAGDVNGDGIADIIIGAPRNDQNGSDAGRSYLYMISMTGNDVEDLRFMGETAHNYFGSVSSAGDVNGDGFSDIIVGAVGYNLNMGRAYIFFGGPSLDNVADVTMTGEAMGNSFGYDVSNAGDVNGDGFSDVIVSAYQYNNLGRTYIFFGGSSMDGSADVAMTGEDTLGNFGRSVSTAGDVNGDGFSDVVVGADLYHDTGRVYVFFGGSSVNNIADVIIKGAHVGALGYSVSTAGDVNGDGFSDIIVGNHWYNSFTGSAYIYFGGASMDPIADVYLTGEATYNEFGRSVSSAGDVNGDGYSDVIVGAEGYTTSTGRAYIFFGGLSMNHFVDVIMTGEAIGNYFGRSVSSAGDVNGDGYSDVIVGAISGTGKAYIFYGATIMNTLADVTMTGEASNDYFGQSVSTAGDINNDGYSDVIVGAFRYSWFSPSYLNIGAAYLFMSTSPQVSPCIISVKDIPFDEGGKVLLRWARSGYDIIGQNLITGYLIERSAPPGINGYAWEPVTTIAATIRELYSYSASTYNDSMSNNNDATFFQITAQTQNPSQYWRSNIMSGYSVDNLAPVNPQNLAGAPDNNSINLTWNQNEETDLHHYAIYRDGVEIATSVNNNFDDVTVLEDSTYDYQVTAVDIHGNISPLSNLVSVTFNNFGTLNLTIIMEGFYDASLNNMRISDTLTVYLRNSISPFAAIDSATAVINAGTFIGSFQLTDATTGTYYIQVSHRNTIETWSSVPVSYTQGSTHNYDFSISASQAFGDNMKQVDTSPLMFAIYSGDVNNDGIVDLTDIINVFNDADLFLSGYVMTDVNGDDFVDLSDIVITFNNSNAFVSVIRP